MPDQISLTTIAQLARGAAWRLEKLHSYDHDLLIWITRGQGRAILGGVRRGINTHNAIYIPAETLVSFDLGKQGFGLALHLPARAGLGFPDDLTHLRIRDVQAQAEITGYLEHIQREVQVNAPFADESLRAYAALASVWVRRQLIAQPEDPRTNAATRLVQAFCALVPRHLHSGLSMADYAAMLGVTPTHLTRSCRECTDMTAADMLTECTLYRARDLIEDSDSPFQQIAADLGFGSAAYFTRFVQNHTGSAPSDLRRKALLTKR